MLLGNNWNLVIGDLWPEAELACRC